MEEVRGWFPYKGVTCMQARGIDEKLKVLFQNKKPVRILEIGTASGGLTLLIRDVLDECGLEDCDVRSYDVIDTSHNYLLNDRIDFRMESLFNLPYSDLVDHEELPNYIQGEGVTIVMCDGGSKKNEFNIFGRYLKPGDIIMAHDYSPSMEYFEEHVNGKIWDWCEITDADIEKSVKDNNLDPYMPDEFQEVVWVCKIKK